MSHLTRSTTWPSPLSPGCRSRIAVAFTRAPWHAAQYQRQRLIPCNRMPMNGRPTDAVLENQARSAESVKPRLCSRSRDWTWSGQIRKNGAAPIAELHREGVTVSRKSQHLHHRHRSPSNPSRGAHCGLCCQPFRQPHIDAMPSQVGRRTKRLWSLPLTPTSGSPRRPRHRCPAPRQRHQRSLTAPKRQHCRAELRALATQRPRGCDHCAWLCKERRPRGS